MSSIRRAAPAAVVALLAGFVLVVATGSAVSHVPAASGSAVGPAVSASPGSTDPATSGGTGTSASSGPTNSIGDPRPNIVVIMSDDMRDDDLRYMPNVQRLIGDQGVRFANTFSPQPLCCPARASFATGMYSHNHKVWSHAEPYGFHAFRDEQTLPVWLEEVGYHTAFLGKYLNGYGRQPLRDGSSSVHYVPPGWTDWRASVDGSLTSGPEYEGGTYRYYDTTLNVNGRLVPHQGTYNTRLFGDQSLQVIDEYARSPQPFFLWASYVAPHIGMPHEDDDPGEITRSDGGTTSLRTPARPRWVRGEFDDVITEAPGADGEKDVSDKPFFIRHQPPANAAEKAGMLEVTRQRAESLAVLDVQVERMIDALERTGELDNTLVVFTSDNGYFIGEHRGRQGKVLPYEPSLRVPLVLRGPGIPHGEVRRDPFTMLDFAPTFLAAAGAQPQDSVDGVNLLGVARHGDRGWTRGILTETGPRVVSGDVAESDNFLVRGDGPSPLRFSQGVRAPRYLYVEHASREKELYDLRRDPEENHNVVDRPSRHHVVAELARMLDRLRNCVGSECATPLPTDLRSN